MTGATRRERIVADYRAGVPYRVMKKRYGCSTVFISRAVRAAGATMRGPVMQAKPVTTEMYMTDAEINAPGGTNLDVDNVLALSEQRNRDAAAQVAQTLAGGKARVLDGPIELYAAARRESGIR